MIDVLKYKLKMVAVHFSTVCGAKCSFCYAGNTLQLKQLQTSKLDIYKCLSSLQKSGVEEILFVGGDPILHPEFYYSLALCKEFNFNVTVLSNSWEIRPRSSVKQVVSLINNIEATILGNTPKLHDELVGIEGAYERLTTNLINLNRPIGVCINAMPQNIEYIYSIVTALYELGIKKITSLNIQRIIPSGSAGGTFKFGLRLDDINLLMSQIDRAAVDFGITISFEDPVPWCTVDPLYHKYLSKCDWGYSKGSIDYKGDLTRCGANDNYTRLGSIFDGDIQQRWNEHPILRSFRDKSYLPEECQICELLEFCGGGCPLSCGTCKDHDLDALYVEKHTKIIKKNTEVSIYRPDGQINTRTAYPSDWGAICKLEKEIFNNGADELFTRGCCRLIAYP